MFVAQRERINAIINSLTGLPSGITLSGLQTQPNSLENLELPVILPVIPALNYDRNSASDFMTVTTWNLYIFIRPEHTGNAAQHSVESLEMLDLLADEFLKRPRLHLNDNGLAHVRDTRFTNWRNLTKPIPYPINTQGPRYWGAIGDLTVYQRKIKRIGD